MHAGGMVHHDIKPANVLVRATGDGTDFALADSGYTQLGLKISRPIQWLLSSSNLERLLGVLGSEPYGCSAHSGSLLS